MDKKPTDERKSRYDNTDGRIRGRRLQARRLRIWSRNPYCRSCGILVNYPDGFQLDHIVPLFKGGKDDESNCQVLCIRCHDLKTHDDLGRQVEIGLDGWPKLPEGL